MTKRHLQTSLFIFALIATFVALWMRSGNNHSNSETTSAMETSAKAASSKTISSTPATLQSPFDRADRTLALLEAANVPITFWGKVVDEAGVGIPGVSIMYRIHRAGRLEANGAITEDGVKASLASSANGLFSIMNARGTTLSIEGFTKDGYELSANQHNVFGYSGTPALHTPNQQSPQIFMMRSNKTQIDVSSISRQIRMPWDGKALRIDLDSGNPSPSGKLVLTANRTALTGRFGWSLSIAIDGGEVREAEKGTAFIAPENGYLPIWQCRYAADANPWRFGHDANVYYRLNGKYGRIKVQIYADAGPNDVSLYLERFVNNSGARNTEGRQ